MLSCRVLSSTKCTGPKCDTNRKRVDHLVNTKHLLWWFIKTQRLRDGMLFIQCLADRDVPPLALCLFFLRWSSTHCDLKKNVSNIKMFLVVSQQTQRLKYSQVCIWKHGYCLFLSLLVSHILIPQAPPLNLCPSSRCPRTFPTHVVADIANPGLYRWIK